MLHLESHCYDKSCPDPTLITPSISADQKSFLVCFIPLLDVSK
jgi:hypothetical protein